MTDLTPMMKTLEINQWLLCLLLDSIQELAASRYEYGPFRLRVVRGCVPLLLDDYAPMWRSGFTVKERIEQLAQIQEVVIDYRLPGSALILESIYTWQQAMPLQKTYKLLYGRSVFVALHKDGPTRAVSCIAGTFTLPLRPEQVDISLFDGMFDTEQGDIGVLADWLQESYPDLWDHLQPITQYMRL